MSDKTTPTASEVNRRIAEFMGYRDIIVSTRWHDMLEGIKPGYRNHEGIPDYMHDANAASAAIERYCREHNKVADLFFNGKVWVSQIGDNFFCAPDEQAEADEQIATAASLALFAVLGEGS